MTNRNLRCGISRKWYEIQNSYQQKTIIKSHIGYTNKYLNIALLTFILTNFYVGYDIGTLIICYINLLLLRIKDIIKLL